MTASFYQCSQGGDDLSCTPGLRRILTLSCLAAFKIYAILNSEIAQLELFQLEFLISAFKHCQCVVWCELIGPHGGVGILSVSTAIANIGRFGLVYFFSSFCSKRNILKFPSWWMDWQMWLVTDNLTHPFHAGWLYQAKYTLIIDIHYDPIIFNYCPWFYNGLSHVSGRCFV